jgi:hypothetical protein
MDTKICKNCNIEKSINDFCIIKSKKNKEYKFSFCNICKKERLRLHHKKRQDFINNIKHIPCLDCKNIYPPECMDFDHCRGNKNFNIGENILKNIDELLLEIEKCDIICANCHRIRTKKRINESKTSNT